MPEFDGTAAVLAMRDLMATAPYLATVSIGAPETLSLELMGWVTFGGPGAVEVSRHGNVPELSIELHCSLGYAVQDDAQQAELMVGRYVPDMMARLARNGFESVGGVGRNLNGACARMEQPRALVGAETYALRLGSEIRVYSMSVLVALNPKIGA